MFNKLIYLTSPKQKNWCLIYLFILISYSLFEAATLALVLPYIQMLQFYGGIEDNPGFFENIFVFFNFNTDIQNQLVVASLVLFFLIILKTVLQTYTTFLGSIIPYNIFREISNELNKKYIFMPWIKHIRRNSNELIKNTIKTTEFTAYAYMIYLQAISNIIISIFILAVLFYVNFIITISILIFFMFLGFFIYKPIKKILNVAGEQREISLEILNKTASEIYLSNKEIKVLGKEKKFINIFNSHLINLKNAFWKQAFYPRLASPIIEALATIILIVSVLFCIYLEVKLVTFISYLIFFAVAGRRLLPSLLQFLSNLMTLKGLEPSIDIVYDEYRSNIIDLKDMVFKEVNFKSDFSMNNIVFRYEDNIVINDVSIKFKKNKKTAIVGRSGSGKSTILNLLLGLIEPESGSFLLIKKSSSLKYLRKKIGFVPQKVNIIDGTMCENIAFGENAINEKVHEVLRFAGLETFILESKEGIHTNIGEQGTRLSGGQLQRIGIARALYNDPEILIFDEATSSLDYITEDIINDTIKELSKTKTIITITHRLSSVKNYDLIYVLDKGNLVDKGNHNYLIKKSKIYQKMETLS